MSNIFRITVSQKDKSFNSLRLTYLVLDDSLEGALKSLNPFDEFNILSTELVTDTKISEVIYRESRL